MKKQFTFQEVVTYSHTIEIEVSDNKEDEYEDFADQTAEEFFGSDDKDDLIMSFIEEYGSENITFIKDGSPEVEITCY